VRAQRVEIFHVAADDRVLREITTMMFTAINTSVPLTNLAWTREWATHVGAIPDDLVLKLFPTLHAALDEHLRAQTKGLGGEVAQFVWVVGEAGAQATECEGGPQDDGIADFIGCLEGS
jgi:hypothetical protein